MTTDLLVVGAGPVGLGAAIEAARAGLSVTVLDAREGPVDKACGEGLMPTARAALRRLGVEPEGMEFHGIRYVAGDRAASALFTGGPGLGVRRTALSAALDKRVRDLGITRVVGRATLPVVRDGVVTSAGETARWLVAADGLHSPMRRWLGLDAQARAGASAGGGRSGVGRTGRPRARLRYGLRQHYRIAPWTDLVEVHWAADCEAYVTPVAPDLVGVAVLCPGGETYERWLDRFPALRDRLAGAAPVSQVRGAGPLRQDAVRRVRGRVMLVGDAAGYVDAVTGEGISVGLTCARSLVRCLVEDRPQDYEREWVRATRRYRTLTGGLVWAAGQPALRAAIVPAATRLPRVFGGIVNSLG